MWRELGIDEDGAEQPFGEQMLDEHFSDELVRGFDFQLVHRGLISLRRYLGEGC